MSKLILNIISLKSILFILFFILPFVFFAQDTIPPKIKTPPQESLVIKKVRKEHSPTAASLMSMIVPGLGQAYNRKYWKLPIIYGALGGLYYYSDQYNESYHLYKDIFIVKEDTSAINLSSIFKGLSLIEKQELMDKYSSYSSDVIETEMDKWRRARDFNYIIMGMVYIFNIVDASVDANLFTFDVSDDLSLNLNPNYLINKSQQTSIGLKLTLSFNNKLYQ